MDGVHSNVASTRSGVRVGSILIPRNLLTHSDVTGIIIPKSVRFRIEFLPQAQWSSSTGSTGSSNSPRSPNPSIRSQGTGSVITSMTMVQEKGALSAFKAVYGRIRAEWR